MRSKQSSSIFHNNPRLGLEGKIVLPGIKIFRNNIQATLMTKLSYYGIHAG